MCFHRILQAAKSSLPSCDERIINHGKSFIGESDVSHDSLDPWFLHNDAKPLFLFNAGVLFVGWTFLFVMMVRTAMLAANMQELNHYQNLNYHLKIIQHFNKEFHNYT